MQLTQKCIDIVFDFPHMVFEKSKRKQTAEEDYVTNIL